MSTPPLPPPVLKAEKLKVERYQLPSGQVVSRYVDRATGQPVALPEAFHLTNDPTDLETPA